MTETALFDDADQADVTPQEAARLRRGLSIRKLPDGPCLHCGRPVFETIARIIDGRPLCIPCGACTLPTCAAWNREPGQPCDAHQGIEPTAEEQHLLDARRACPNPRSWTDALPEILALRAIDAARGLPAPMAGRLESLERWEALHIYENGGTPTAIERIAEPAELVLF